MEESALSGAGPDWTVLSETASAFTLLSSVQGRMVLLLNTRPVMLTVLTFVGMLVIGALIVAALLGLGPQAGDID